MATLKHSISIAFNPSTETYNSITKILNVTPTPLKPIPNIKINFGDPSDWTYEVDVSTNEEYYDFINIFCDILEGKYDELKLLGIEREDIVFWTLYGYDTQCNMEYPPEELRRLGINGIKLCISCWEAGSYLEL